MLDTHDGTLLATTSASRDPVALAVASAAGHVFVANRAGGDVSVLDAMTGRLVRRTPTGASPSSIVVSAATGRVFVVNGGDDTVSMLDAVSGALVSTVPVGTAPRALAVDGPRGVIAVGASDNTVSVLDARGGRVSHTLHLSETPVAMAVDAATGALIVGTNRPDGTGRVAAIDPTTGVMLYRTAVDEGVTTLMAGGPGQPLVVGTTSGIELLNLATGERDTEATVAAGLAGVETTPSALAADPAHGRLMAMAQGRVAANGRFMTSGRLRVLNAGSGVGEGYVPLGHSPVAVAIDRQAGRVLVLDNADDTVTVLDKARL